MSISNVYSFQDLENPIQNSEIYLSFFGTPTVYSQSDQDVIPLETLAERIVILGDRATKYTYNECQAAVNIRSKLLTHYQVSDQLAEKSWNPFVILYRAVDAICRYFIHINLYFALGYDARYQINCDDKYSAPAVFDQAVAYQIPFEY